MTDDVNEPWFEIERRLRDDPDGLERDALRQRLDEAVRSLKRRMDMGVPPTEFAGLERIQGGLAAAIEVIERVWRLHHRRTT